MFLDCLTNLLLVSPSKRLKLLAVFEEGESWHGLDFLLGGEVVKFVNVDLEEFLQHIGFMRIKTTLYMYSIGTGTVSVAESDSRPSSSKQVVITKKNKPWGTQLCRPFLCSLTPTLGQSFCMGHTRLRKSRQRPRCSNGNHVIRPV